jgi:hypothetical protein
MDSDSNRHLIRDHPLLHDGHSPDHKGAEFRFFFAHSQSKQGLPYGAESISKPSRKQVLKGRLNLAPQPFRAGLTFSVGPTGLDEQLSPSFCGSKLNASANV